ncbi:guanidinobutyrase [Patella vulgata]|uniref:guanidinobutyrase n=1 Tax=Patella vulgata TaxID=6465 RepID=UPI00218032C0|nr:guanidinobutyrase [Patella vulgata]
MFKGIYRMVSNIARVNTTTLRYGSTFNQPISGNDLSRSAGIASLFRLPIHHDSKGLDVCFVGACLDSGASNRSGTRLGPRHIRVESTMIRPYNMATGAQPFDSLNVGDVGDVSLCMYDLPRACNDIKTGVYSLIKDGCKAITLGGDHTISYPLLQAVKDKYGPVGLIHLDAHSDTSDTMFGCKIAHGTPFRRAVEDGCLDCSKVVQIGLRGPGYSLQDRDWSIEQGFRMITAEECWNKSLVPLMANIRQMMGDAPVYISFDIDALDPSYAPGTGTPEIGGLTIVQALEIIRGCRGLNIIGGDMVEVSPPFDSNGLTSLTAANLLFEMLCIFPGVQYNK